MEEGQQRSHNTAIVVALITVFGGIGTAVVANWEKIFGSDPSPQPGPQPAPRPAEQDGVSTSNAVLPAPAVETPPAPAANIAGVWTDAAGMQEQFTQQGSGFSYRQFAAGMLVGEGSGQVVGQTLSYTFRFNNGQVALTGRCNATLHGNDLVEGTCTPDGAPPFAVEMRR